MYTVCTTIRGPDHTVGIELFQNKIFESLLIKQTLSSCIAYLISNIEIEPNLYNKVVLVNNSSSFS